MNLQQRLFSGLSAALVLTLTSTAAGAWHFHENGEVIEFDVANVFFELNDTDGDLGIHALIDGEPWKWLAICDPNGHRMMNVRNRGRLRRQGLTELFFESSELPFESDDPDEVTLTPEQFFNRFPAGIYEIKGVTVNYELMAGESEVSQVMPAPANGITVNGLDAAEDCDAAELPEVAGGPVTIDWDPVTTSHPELGQSDPDIEIVAYQFVAEYEDENEVEQVYSVDLPPTVTDMVIPGEFIELSDEFKFEILVREASGNQTAVESCFEVAEE